MKKRFNLNSIMSRFILAIVLFSSLIMLIATPIIQTTAFRTFTPYLVENLTDRIGDSAALMSLFLGRSNPVMYGRTYTEDFFNSVNDYCSGKVSQSVFEDRISDIITPFETELNDYDYDIKITSYPAYYIEGKGLFCSPEIKSTAEALVSSGWFEDYKTNHIGESLYSPVIAPDGVSQDNGYMANVYSYSFDREEPVTYIAACFTKFSDFMEFWQSTVDIDKTDYAFIGQDYNVLYQNNEASNIDFDWIPNNLTSDRQHHVVNISNDDSSLFSVLISRNREGLRFVMNASEKTFLDIFRHIYKAIGLILLSFVLLYIFIVIILFRNVSKRLTALSDKMAVVRDGNYDVKLDDSRDDEIGQLASAFNLMTDKINKNVNDLMEKERREKLLQYNLMVSAIDPHFINNTLNTSTRLAELGRTDDVVEVNDALINFLKNNLKMKTSQFFDTVSNEINALEEYIKIQNYLCDNTISLRYDISPENMRLSIPKFLIQPIVENAILHGILMNINEKGENIAGIINISVDPADDRIIIKVGDNGIGMTRDVIEKYCNSDLNRALDENKGTHIGILNVRARLADLYGDDYSFKAESEPGKGTVITMEIPAEHFMEN